MGLKYPHDLCVIPGDNDSDSVTWNILTFEVASRTVRSLIILHDKDLEAVVPLAMKLYRFVVRFVQAWKFALQTSLWNDNLCYLWIVEALVDLNTRVLRCAAQQVARGISRPRVRNSTRHDNSKHRGGYATSHNTSTLLASHICMIYCQMAGCVGPSDTSYIGFEQPFIHSSDLSHVVDGFFRIRLKFACAEETVELPGSKLPFKFGTAAVGAHWQ
ncbi:hypothetical protein CY34DRAFT_570407 [Suillus luteus UH-Slu-Lm8-n1]|uniref:Uncharacterized protein n=1 Tax=Suillus luteus UH-Slu-Lm8-n1 TaxID=930992 RepID=A0A0D0A1A1_9AGAM|nr:hypothetical protein CY34DRAFT_570407 [Suillus luteus UH-Slu-Lm8-n1]